jgi:hypothetical protein
MYPAHPSSPSFVLEEHSSVCFYNPMGKAGVIEPTAHGSVHTLPAITTLGHQRAMSSNLLTEAVFEATTEGKMSNVTERPGGCVDIWPYVKKVQQSVDLPQSVVEGQFVHCVYRSQFDHCEHVLIPTGRHNVFLVVVVDRVHGSVYGQRVLDLNEEYGLAGAIAEAYDHQVTAANAAYCSQLV